MTLIEILIVVSVTGLLVIPLLAWMIMGIKVNAQVQTMSADTESRNLLTAYLARDGAGAASAMVGGVDCSGGDGAGGTVVLTMSLAAGTERSVVYSAVTDAAGHADLWRRQCAPGAAPGSVSRIVESIVAPAGGWPTAVACSDRPGRSYDTCGRIDVAFTTTDGHLVQSGVTRRIGTAQ